MVDSTITSAILLIAVVVATAATVNAIYPSLFSAIGSISSTTASADSRSKTLVAITSHYLEPDYGTLRLWAKNSGEGSIADSELANARIYYGSENGPLKNYALSYTIDDPGNGDTNWDTGETLAMTITANPIPHDPGTYRVRMVLPNGAISEYTFTI